MPCFLPFGCVHSLGSTGQQVSYLPVPNAQEVEEFRVLCKGRIPVTLSCAEALDWAIRLLHLFYLTSYQIFFISADSRRPLALVWRTR